MRVSEVLNLSGNFEGLQIVIEGIFIMEPGAGYFCEDIGDIESRDRSILVDVPNLEARLLSCVPAYGGSKYSYCDQAKISGALSSCHSRGFKFSIANVDSFVIYKHGNAIPVEI